MSLLRPMKGTLVSSLKTLVREAHLEGRALLLPGAYDSLSARIIQDLGFEAVYVTGAGLANSRLGVPDIGLVTLTELRDHVALLADAVDLPLVVDADTGFGNAVNVVRTVQLLERAGASALQLEDQVFPKKCGHFEGKAVIPVDEMVAKIKAAVDTRRSDDLVIIARTDARAISSLDEALDRGHAYQEAGADVIFIEAPESIEELTLVGKSFDVPLVANMVEGGKTPAQSAEELAQLGFSMVLFANAALRSAQKSVREVLAEIHKSGSTAAVLDRLSSWEERQNGVGKPHFDMLERKYAVNGAS